MRSSPSLYEKLPMTEIDEVIQSNTERTTLLNLGINIEKKYEDPHQVDDLNSGGQYDHKESNQLS